MFAVCVTFRIRKEQMQKFMPRMQKQAHDSLTLEPGCQRFDICSQSAAGGTVFLYELYEDSAAFDLHNDSAHFKSFAADVSNWVAGKEVKTFDIVDTGEVA